MIYVKDITTTFNRSSSSPLITALKVTKGLVYRVEVSLPPGPCGFLHIAIFDGGYQVWPREYGETFSGDAETISFDDIYLKLAAPFEFQISTYNEDDTYDHWCQIRIGLVSEEAFMARFLPTYAYKEFRETIQMILMEQEAAKQATIETPFSWVKSETEEE